MGKPKVLLLGEIEQYVIPKLHLSDSFLRREKKGRGINKGFFLPSRLLSKC
jgi:hypothetical protein